MNENNTIPKESLYPPGEQPAERMQINELGIIEGDVNNGAETGINTTLPPPAPAPVTQKQVPPSVPSSPSVPNVPAAQKQVSPQAVAQPNVNKAHTNQNSVTYFEDTLNGNGIEVDLVSFREKGEETRFLSFVIKNVVESEEYKLQTTMDTEERFMQFKQFVANLNWND